MSSILSVSLIILYYKSFHLSSVFSQKIDFFFSISQKYHFWHNSQIAQLDFVYIFYKKYIDKLIIIVYNDIRNKNKKQTAEKVLKTDLKDIYLNLNISPFVTVPREF